MIPNPAAPPTAAVLGGGPAGLMAASVLAAAGVDVTVYDRMPTVGRKLVLAGRSGLNLTHAEPRESFLARYGSAAGRLGAALDAFDPGTLRAWASELGEPTFVGSSGRVFPESFRATPLLRSWLQRLSSAGVRFAVRHRWEGWAPDGALVFSTPDGPRVVRGDVTVLAFGGGSWPRVGSDGAWVHHLRTAGVTVHPLVPANCGFEIAWSRPFRDRFGGVPVKHATWSHAGVSVRGEAVITRYGIEGGAVYQLSGALRDDIAAGGPTRFTVDLCPDQHVSGLRSRLGAGRARDSVATALRRVGVAPVGVGLVREATGNEVPRDPEVLARLVKSVRLLAVAPRPLERAISSAGGVALDEVDDAYMLRRRPGTFVAGEMLDWEAPTGGYLLQACFSTGVAAGRGAVAHLGTRATASELVPREMIGRGWGG